LGVVANIFDQLSQGHPGGSVLNDPRRVWQRYELLTGMSRAGINGFTAYRASEDTGSLCFPAFVRETSRHDGPLTGLLSDRRELAKALLALRARGFRRSDLLVVEFCDLRNEDGLYRSGAAFKVGEQIVAAHLLRGRNWMLKWDGSDHDEPAMQEHLEYVLSSPHEPWLRHAFALAGVDYGRIDYGIQGNRLQVWEINTNPTLGPSLHPEPSRLAPRIEAMLQEARTFHHRALQAAFRSLDGDGEARPAVHLAPALIDRALAEMAASRRRLAARGFLQQVYGLPGIGQLFRSVYSRFLPLK
jgi:hypothetical protein